MKGDSQILKLLSDLLGHELASSELYLVQAQLLANWGYSKLAERIRHESDDERAHAEKLIERIVFFEGVPGFGRPALAIGTSVKEILEFDLKYELEIAANLNRGIADCQKHLDAGTRQILDDLLKDTEEDHIHWLEQQLRLIEQVGLAGYLAEQL